MDLKSNRKPPLVEIVILSIEGEEERPSKARYLIVMRKAIKFREQLSCGNSKPSLKKGTS
jgi:hypothetical protein